MEISDTSWTGLVSTMCFGDLPGVPNSKGKPYLLSDITKIVSTKGSGSILNFDKRLLRELKYIGSGFSPLCGWNALHDARHDRIAISADSAPPASSPTLDRGVGVRITQAGYIRCSWISNGNTANHCPPPSPPLAFSRYKILFDKPVIAGGGVFAQWDPIITPFPTYLPQCIAKVICAVDYYPLKGTGCEKEGACTPTESAVSGDDLLLKPLLSPPFFTCIGPTCEQALVGTQLNAGGFAKEAAVYKIAQLTLQLMKTDLAGCENLQGNVGGDRNIPTTIILPQWAAAEMETKNVWSQFLTLAQTVFPYNLQTESPLAGLSYDPNLNGKAGLHFNY